LLDKYYEKKGDASVPGVAADRLKCGECRLKNDMMSTSDDFDDKCCASFENQI